MVPNNQLISLLIIFFVYSGSDFFWRQNWERSMGVWHISTTTRISKAIFFHISKGCRSHTTMKFISSSWYIDIQLDINILTRIKPVFLYLWGGLGGKHTAVESFYNFNLQSSKSHLHSTPLPETWAVKRSHYLYEEIQNSYLGHIW